MTTSGGYVFGNPATTTQTIPAAVTPAAGALSLSVFNNSEIEAYEIGKLGIGANNFMSTLLDIGAQLGGGKYNNQNIAESMTTNYPEIKFKEIDTVTRAYTLGANVLVGDSSITLNSTVGLQEGDILRVVTTNEHVRINSVTSGTVVAVSRAFGTIAATAASSGADVVFIGSAVATGVAFRTAYASQATDKVNYIQKFTTAVQITDEDKLSNKVTAQSNFVNRMMQERLQFHMHSIEHVALFGQKKSTTDGSGRTLYATEGVLQTALRGWTGDISSGLSKTTMERELSRPFQYSSSGIKIALLGSEARATLRGLFDSQVQTTSIMNSEMKFSTIEMNSGKLVLVDHPFLDTLSGYSKYGIIVDPELFNVVYPQGAGFEDKMDGKTTFRLDPTSTYALERGEYTTYLGFKNINANAHGVFKITS